VHNHRSLGLKSPNACGKPNWIGRTATSATNAKDLEGLAAVAAFTGEVKGLREAKHGPSRALCACVTPKARSRVKPPANC